MTTGEWPTQTNPIVPEAAPRLALIVHPGKGNERSITCRRAVTLLGSHAGCKLTMKHRRVAPVHVAIINDGSRLLAVDLVTKHGTLLNGLKMEQEGVNDGDMLLIHPWEFRLDVHEPTHAGHSDAHPFGLEPSPHGDGHDIGRHKAHEETHERTNRERDDERQDSGSDHAVIRCRSAAPLDRLL